MRSTWNLLSKAGAASRSTIRQTYDVHRKRFERNRTMWELMVWTFVVYHQFDEAGWLFSKAYASTADDGDAQVRLRSDPVQVGAADGQSDPDGSTSNDGAPDAGTATDFRTPIEPILSSGWQGADASLLKSVAVGSHSWHNHFQMSGGGSHGGGGEGGGGSFGAAFYSHANGGSFHGRSIQITPEQFDPAQLQFFDGLKAFAGQLGFVDGISALASATGESAQTLVGATGGFSENALSPLSYWLAEGGLAPDLTLRTSDVFNVDWAVQLNGVVDGTAFSVSRFSGWNAELESSQDVEHKSFGNEATLTDGGDWSGALAVAGNYYEFNTIIQINLLWDNDRITLDNYGGRSASGSPTVVRTGENIQTNNAEIVSAHDAGDDVDARGSQHQLIVGGVTTSTSVLQLNVIMDLDRVSFDLDGMLGDTIGSLDFANVFSAGHVQSNVSTIETAPGTAPVGTSLKDYILSHMGGKLGYVAGDYYELNTVVQLNAAFDRDTIVMSALDGAPSGNGGSDIIASGGVIQFNSARIQAQDSLDDLFVGGRYTEFNLVLQINVLDDSDIITQIQHARDPALGNINVDPHGADGHDGSGGSDMSRFALPSVFDDPMHRGGAELTG